MDYLPHFAKVRASCFSLCRDAGNPSHVLTPALEYIPKKNPF